MRRRAVKRASTAAAAPSLRKTQPPSPHPNDGAAPPNHLSPPSNDEKGVEFNQGNVDREERSEFTDDHPQLETEGSGGAIVGMGSGDFEEEGGQGRFDGNDAKEMKTEYLEEVEREKMERHEVEGVSNEVEERQDVRYKVFVAGLDNNATEEDLRKVFDEVGEVTNVRLSRDTKFHRRVAFLTFATIEQAYHVICEISDPVINGKRCWTAQIKDSCNTLCVRNICTEWTKEDLKDKLAEYGVQNYEVLTLNPDRKNKGKNRGYAHLDFRSKKDANEALQILQKENVLLDSDRAAKAELSCKYASRNDKIMSHVKRVFLDGLPGAWREEHVKENLAKFGRIVKVELARDIPSAMRTNYCYVTFETHEAAEICVNGVNGDGIDYRGEMVNLWAELAKPRVRIASEDQAQRRSSVVQEIGQGSEVQQDSHRSHTDARSAIDHSKRSETSCMPYNGGPRESFSPRDRNAVPHSVGRQRQSPSLERLYTGRPAVPSHGISRAAAHRPSRHNDYSHERYTNQPSNYYESHSHDYNYTSGSKRPHFSTEEVRPRNTGPFVHQSRARVDRENSYRSHSQWKEHSSRTGYGEGAAHRPSHHNDYSYERYTKQPSNYDESHSRDYNYPSGSKRPHPEMGVRPRNTETSFQRSRARVDRENSYRSHSQWKEHSSRTRYGEGAAHRPSHHNDYSYERYNKQPSNYYESHSRDYNYTSGSKRPHPEMEGVRPRNTETSFQRSRARVDRENSYRSYSQWKEHSSRTGYGEGASSSVRNSHGLSDSRTSTVASRGREVDRGDDQRMPSRYGMDYTSRDHLRSASDDAQAGSHPSDFHNSRVKDGGSSSRRDSRKYH